MGDLYLWRQVFILTTTIFTTIGNGMMVAFPSVLYPALLSVNNTDIEGSSKLVDVSWISTSNGIAGIFGFFILSPIMQIFGRKIVHITDNSFLCIGWIILALAHSMPVIFAARLIQGVEMGSKYIHGMIISEYSDPKRRGYFMTFKKAAIAVGTVTCHALSLIWSWRQIATFAIMISALAMILTLFWPESPSYLAMKCRFKESEKSFVWLHGGSNMQELHILHSSLRQKVNKNKTEKWYTFLLKKDFWKSFVMVSLLTLIVELSGKHYFVVYIIQMMMELVEDKSLAIYLAIGADLFTFSGLLSSFFVIRRFKRRTILFAFGATTVGLMLVISSVIVLKSFIVPWLAPVLVVLHSFVVNISIIPVCYTLFSEIVCLEYKGWGSSLTGVIFICFYTLLLRCTPVLIESTGVGGVYATYGVSIATCLLILYFMVPETKDKTLQEIENQLKGLSDCPESLMRNNSLE